MSKLADNQFLKLRGKVWTYYRRVPAELVTAAGRSFIKKSLRTSDIKEARKLRNVESVRIDAWFESLAKEQSSADKPGANSSISYDVLENHVRQYVNALDKRASSALASAPPTTSQDLAELRMNAEIELGILKNPDDPRRDEWIASFGERVLDGIGYGSMKEDELIVLGSLLKRALIELLERKIGRYHDRHIEFSDSLFDPSRKPLVTFEALVNDYLEERRVEGAANGISSKTIEKDEAVCRMLMEIVGSDREVSSIDYDVVQNVRRVIAHMPSNRTKLFPGKSLEQVLELSKNTPSSWMAPLTQRKYLDPFSHILALAVKKRLIPSNPAADIKPIRRDNVALEDKRNSWRADQLKAFFEGKFYQRFAQDAPAPYTKADAAWRFWMPLIMLYSGARPNEVAQLIVADFQTTAKGTHFINFLDDDTDEDDLDGIDSQEGREVQLKTKTSRRRIPIHQMLLRIGLLEYVKHVAGPQKNKSARLFPTLKANKHGNYAWYALRRFNEHFFQEEMKRGRRQSAYSFRHTARDALRAVEAPPSALKAITGWASGPKSSADNYGDPNNPDFHVKWVEKIQYDLNLSFLYGAGAKLKPAPPKRTS